MTHDGDSIKKHPLSVERTVIGYDRPIFQPYREIKLLNYAAERKIFHQRFFLIICFTTHLLLTAMFCQWDLLTLQHNWIDT